MLIATHPEVDRQSPLSESPLADFDARLAVVVEAFMRITAGTKLRLRSPIRLSLDPDSSHREMPLPYGGRAITAVADRHRATANRPASWG